MRKPSLLILAAASAFALSACSSPKKEEPQPKPAAEIMKDYAERLTTAPGKARSAREAAEAQTAEQERRIKELDKQ